jgi:hypothetical protein
MVLALIQSRFKGFNLNTERLKLSRVGVDLPRMLIIKNTNLIAEGSDSLLGLGLAVTVSELLFSRRSIS